MPNYKRYYLDNYYIFITIVTYNRKPILIPNITLLRASFKKALNMFDFEIFGSVILPDHLHLIIKPKDSNKDNFSKIIGTIKRTFTQSINEKPLNEGLPTSRIKRNEKCIWQRRFYDHIIRSEEDLYNHLDYIHYNPVKHRHTKHVRDWEFSSFHKFVKLKNYEPNWGSESDIKNIIELEYE